MFDPRAVAASAGLAVEVSDLGDWNGRLISEYDARGDAIRINVRALEAYRKMRGELSAGEVRAFLDFAIAHELYHHHEATGAVGRLASREQREAAADAFARAMVTVSVRLGAFLAAAGVR